MNSIDKSTKLLLAVIAVALWLIALNPWLQPVSVAAAQDFSMMETYLAYIQTDVSSMKSDLGAIYDGICLNSTICN